MDQSIWYDAGSDECLLEAPTDFKPLCTRAELWAAIDDLERATVEDAMTGDGDALAQAWARVRDLLGVD